jgi:WD40 repeat protein
MEPTTQRMMMGAAGAQPPTPPGGSGNYIAVGNGTAPYFTLLNHTTPGTVSLATTYTFSGVSIGIAFSPDGNYIAVGTAVSPYFTLLNHTIPGTVSLAATYTLPGSASIIGGGVAFSPDGNYIAVGHAVTPYFTLLNHTIPGTLSLAATYASPYIVGGVSFSNSGDTIAFINSPGKFGSRITLLDHSTPGTVSYVSTYTYTSASTAGLTFSGWTSDDSYVVCGGGGSVFLLTPALAIAASYATGLTGESWYLQIAITPNNNYIAASGNLSPYFALLDHTTPGSLSLATTYTGSGAMSGGHDFSPDGNYLAVGQNPSPYFILLNHTTPGSLSLATTYTLSGISQFNDVAFSPN